MENNQNGFQYTYSAKEQAEIKNIRSKYIPKEENKMEQLRRLDASADGHSRGSRRRRGALRLPMARQGEFILSRRRHPQNGGYRVRLDCHSKLPQ